jgi:CheY-like chemotaxis protein
MVRGFFAPQATRTGFDVHAVGNGADGVAAAWEHHPALVTVDLNLPDMDGLEVAQHIRARSKAPGDATSGDSGGQPPVVVLSCLRPVGAGGTSVP